MLRQVVRAKHRSSVAFDVMDALQRAIGVSAAAERLSRRGLQARGLRSRAVLFCDQRGESSLPSSTEVERLLVQRGASQALGKGTYGTVFRGSWRGAQAALKFVAYVRSPLGELAEPLHEYRMNRAFARHGLAWAPLGLAGRRAASGLGLSSNPAQAARRNVCVMALELLPDTLHSALQRDPQRWADLGHLGEALKELVSSAYHAGLAHGDAKANNIGLRWEDSKKADLRYIDFGRSMSRKELQRVIGPEKAEEALRLAAAGDALRLAASCRRTLAFARCPAEVSACTVQPLEDYGRSLLSSEEKDAAVDASTLSRRVHALLLS